jgi:organic hydroperoxide reductase OsmC/OhrA
MHQEHQYVVQLEWTGNQGTGTSNYRSYDRSHRISAAGKMTIEGSSDPAFLGDPTLYNPEELLLASLASCHMLWFLHLCATAGVVVTAYTDKPQGRMAETAAGGGHFVEVILRPRVRVSEAGMIAPTAALHEQAHALCFIANSVNFAVRTEGSCEVG